MRRWIFVAFVAVSCTKWALFPMPRSRTETSGHRPPVQAVEEAADGDRHVYLTAVIWPSGYDWQRDTAGGRAELLLLCDGETRMRTSLLDGSVHRFRNGALWEAGLQEGETVLRRNGEEFLRWEGEESLKGFLPEKDGVYTLTQRVGAPGVRLRRNGELLFSDDRGIVLGSMEESGWDGGALVRDGEGFCYGYFVRINSSQREFRFMEGAQLVQLRPAGSWTEIYDARRRDGTLYLVQSTGTQLLLYKDDTPEVAFSVAKTPWAKILPYGDSVLFFGYNGQSAWKRTPGGRTELFTMVQHIRDYYTEGTADAWIECLEDGMILSLTGPHGKVRISGDYRLMSPVGAVLRGGHFAAGLTDFSGENHLLCLDQQSFPLHFNGYITSISIE